MMALILLVDSVALLSDGHAACVRIGDEVDADDVVVVEALVQRDGGDTPILVEKPLWS